MTQLEVTSPYDGGVVGRVNRAGDDEHEEDLESQRRDNQEIDRSRAVDVIAQERLPGLFGIWRSSRHVPRDRRLTNVQAELQEFAVDPWRTP